MTANELSWRARFVRVVRLVRAAGPLLPLISRSCVRVAAPIAPLGAAITMRVTGVVNRPALRARRPISRRDCARFHYFELGCLNSGNTAPENALDIAQQAVFIGRYQ